jgi:hypothetical protein
MPFLNRLHKNCHAVFLITNDGSAAFAFTLSGESDSFLDYLAAKTGFK